MRSHLSQCRTPPKPPPPPKFSTKHNINNTKITVAKIATSCGRSSGELQVESNCLCGLWTGASGTFLGHSVCLLSRCRWLRKSLPSPPHPALSPVPGTLLRSTVRREGGWGGAPSHPAHALSRTFVVPSEWRGGGRRRGSSSLFALIGSEAAEEPGCQRLSLL